MQQVKEILLYSSFGFPPNTNHAYNFTSIGGKARSYSTESVKSYKALVAIRIKGIDHNFTIPKRIPLKMTYRFYVGSAYINKWDLDGHIKILQDAIFKTGGGNDAWVYQMEVSKHVKPYEGDNYCTVLMEVIR